MAKALKKQNAKDIKGTKLEPKGKFKPISNPIQKLTVARFKQAEFARQFLRVIPAEKHTVEDTLKPEYWANVTDKIQITDRIEAIWEDNSIFAEYIVTDVGPTWAKVILINEVDLTKAKVSTPPEKPSEYKISFGGNLLRHVVVRLSDGKRISEDHATSEAAEQWLSDHKKSR